MNRFFAINIHSLWMCYLHCWRSSRLLWLTDADGAGNSGHAKQQTAAMKWELDWAKHPHVHEIRMSTSDSHCWAVTVKQIMSVGGMCHIPLRHGYLLNVGQTGAIMPLHWNLFHHIIKLALKLSTFLKIFPYSHISFFFLTWINYDQTDYK